MVVASHKTSSLKSMRPAIRSKWYGDATQIQQLLLNLALNALDAMPDGGTIELAAQTAGANVEVTVSDTGKGIDVAILDACSHRLSPPSRTVLAWDWASAGGLRNRIKAN